MKTSSSAAFSIEGVLTKADLGTTKTGTPFYALTLEATHERGKTKFTLFCYDGVHARLESLAVKEGDNVRIAGNLGYRRDQNGQYVLALYPTDALLITNEGEVLEKATQAVNDFNPEDLIA